MKQVFGQSDVSLQMLRPKFCRKKRLTDPIEWGAFLSFCRDITDGFRATCTQCKKH